MRAARRRKKNQEMEVQVWNGQPTVTPGSPQRVLQVSAWSCCWDPSLLLVFHVQGLETASTGLGSHVWH